MNKASDFKTRFQSPKLSSSIVNGQSMFSKRNQRYSVTSLWIGQYMSVCVCV